MASYKDFLDEVPEYVIKVKQYAKLLVDEGIWDSISHDDVDNWFLNFSNEEEHLLAGLMLEGLVYRSASQTSSLLRNAIGAAISHAIYQNPIEALFSENFLNVLTSKDVRGDIRLVPVIRDSDPPTKSGPSVARLYKREIKINDDYMIWPWLIGDNYKKGVRVFVFIDDTLATGKQFSAFIEHSIDKEYKDACFIYIPLLAHEKGLKFIKSKHERLLVSPVEVVSDEFSFFKTGKAALFDDIEELYLKVAKKYLNKRLYRKMAKGYEGLSLTFSYSHSTPNASLPLYWYDSDDFSPLVRR